MTARMFRTGDRVRVLKGWEREIRGCDGPHPRADCERARCHRHGRGNVGLEGTIVGTLIDDCGASPQDPGLLVDNGIGLVWPEEIELVAPVRTVAA